MTELQFHWSVASAEDFDRLIFNFFEIETYEIMPLDRRQRHSIFYVNFRVKIQKSEITISMIFCALEMKDHEVYI